MSDNMNMLENTENSRHDEQQREEYWRGIITQRLQDLINAREKRRPSSKGLRRASVIPAAPRLGTRRRLTQNDKLKIRI